MAHSVRRFGETAIGIIISVLALAILVGGTVLARKNLREGRGDRAGAFTLACAVVAALWVLWVCQVHVSASMGMLGIFLLTVCTTVFYGVLFWAIYLALEPFYLGATVFVLSIPIVIASWAFHTSVGGRVWKADLFR